MLPSARSLMGRMFSHLPISVDVKVQRQALSTKTTTVFSFFFFACRVQDRSFVGVSRGFFLFRGSVVVRVGLWRVCLARLRRGLSS